MTPEEQAAADSHERRIRWYQRRAAFNWRGGEPCRFCGEWVGHWGGSLTRDPCSLLPLDVLFDELRPNCYDVRRHRMVDAIRHAAP